MSDSENFEALLEQYDRNHAQSSASDPAPGDKVEGTLIAVSEGYGFIDLGGKTEGRIDIAALRDPEGQFKYQIGDTIHTTVSGKDPETGTILLGHHSGSQVHGAEEIANAFRQGLPVQGQVTAAIKGGLEVQVSGMRGFCPASQADIRFVENLEEFVGQKFEFRVTKFDERPRPNLVVSRRAILEEQQRAQAEQTRAELKEGAIFTGTVTSLKDYGAFVDIGGLEGMVHVSELAFGHVTRPSEILKIGQTVDVSVLRIDPPKKEGQRERIALSIRALQRDPWLDTVKEFQVGTHVQGKVSRLQPFGAFIELAPGIDGLAHISELGAKHRINHPSEIVKEGDQVEAVVLAIDPERKRISLTLDLEKSVAAQVEEAYIPKSREPEKSSSIGSFGELLKESLQKRS